MEYKKILPNLETRLKLLSLLDFIPDRYMVSLQYLIKTGRRLNLKKPKRYSEKVQWYKLFYRDNLMVDCSDKYKVKDYVSTKGLESIVIPTYGIYRDAEDIKFEKLPNKFVIKSTNGGGGHNVIVCEDVSTFNIEKYKLVMNSWLEDSSTKSPGREWVYDESESKIIIEKYIETKDEKGLIDYKFLCFNGEPEYLFVMTNRNSPAGLNIGIFDMEFNLLSVKRKNIEGLNVEFSKPKNFDAMVKVAKTLSQDFPHVRVDLYNIEGNIYFGELTFFHGSGYIAFEPDEFDFVLGEKFELPNKLVI